MYSHASGGASLDDNRHEGRKTDERQGTGSKGAFHSLTDQYFLG